MEKKKEKKWLKRILIILGIILVLVAAFLIWWFNRKFDVTFKYNNGDEDYVVKVKYLHKIDPDDVKEDLTADQKSFVGYFETYMLTEKDINKIAEDEEAKSTICKDSFKLLEDENKCIAEDEFDFENTKIKKHTTIEAIWSSISFTIDPISKTIYENNSFKITATVTGTSDKTVTWSSENTGVATVDSSGKVTGVKTGTVNIIAESNGIKRKCVVTVKAKEEIDRGTVSLKASDKCMIGSSNSTSITATVSNAKDNTITWGVPNCFSSEKLSDNSIKITRKTSCSETGNFNITAKLSNGNSDSVTVIYEPNLEVKVYDENYLAVTATNGYDNSTGGMYYPVFKANMNVTFNVSPDNEILSKTENSLSLKRTPGYDRNVSISTTCGQKVKVRVNAIIN